MQSTRQKEAVNSSQAHKQANIKAVLLQQYKTADLENLFQDFHYIYDYL